LLLPLPLLEAGAGEGVTTVVVEAALSPPPPGVVVVDAAAAFVCIADSGIDEGGGDAASSRASNATSTPYLLCVWEVINEVKGRTFVTKNKL